jgi:drug/metabolite transporter (DMT)-like permease
MIADAAMRKDHIDFPGAAGLIFISLLLAGNQIIVKLTGQGISPVFQAGLRSLGAMVLVGIWVWWRGIALRIPRNQILPGLILGLLFAAEFVCLFTALDITSVSRASIIFYTMPMQLSLMAHFLIPDERLTGLRILGLVLAFGGVALVLADRAGGEARILGDVLAALGALCWAGIALLVRVTTLQEARPEEQLLWQLVISAVVLLVIAPWFGPLIRDFQPIHGAMMLYQAGAIASFSFLFWFYLMKTYPASNVASFSFLAPVLSVVLAWALLGEALHLSVLAALVLVSAGIYLINRH